MEGRPAYVMFEVRSEEDRAASVAAGKFVGRDVNYVIITPPGSKDTVEKPADEWIAQNEKMGRLGRMPIAWVDGYKTKYEEWKKGNATDGAVSGTHIRLWPALGPSQVAQVLAANVLTVEDLAQANETTLANIGMGGRALKEKAIAWVASAKDIGVVSERINALEQNLKLLTEQNEQLQLINKGLLERVAAQKEKSK
jgi:hypothetical protein